MKRLYGIGCLVAAALVTVLAVIYHVKWSGVVIFALLILGLRLLIFGDASKDVELPRWFQAVVWVAAFAGAALLIYWSFTEIGHGAFTRANAG